MVLTGLEFVGLLGTATGIVGSVAGSVEKIASVYKDVTPCGKRLRFYHASWENCIDRVECWTTKWESNASRSAWSAEGLRSTEVVEENIQYELQQIREYIYAASSFDNADHDAKNWRAILDVRRDIMIDPRAVSLCKRFAVGLWQIGQLKECMDRLSKSVDQLENKSRLEVHKYCSNEEKDREPIASDIRDAATFLARVERLTTALTLAYSSFQDRSQVCGLLMPELNDPQTCVLSNLDYDQLDVNFLAHQQELAANVKARRVIMSYFLDHGTSEDVTESFLSLLAPADLEGDVEDCATLGNAQAARIRRSSNVRSRTKKRSHEE